MVEVGLRVRVGACLAAFCFGWWLVPSRVKIIHEEHRYLPVHEYQHQYKKASGPSIFKGQTVEFFWEVSPFDEEGAPPKAVVDPSAPEQQWARFLDTPVTEDPAKVPYIPGFVPPFFRKNDEFKTIFTDFSIKHSAQEMPEQTRGALILTYYRSGSSFIGQVLNQHPDVFYHFEPLYPFTRDCSADPAYKKTKVETLERILRCDMPNWRHHFMNTIPQRPLLPNDKICLYQGACFRTNSKSMCNRYLCPPAPADRSPFPCSSCGPLNLNIFDHICRKRKLTAAKTIRLCELGWLDELMNKEDFDLKVLHLIRDPRAVARSRLSIHGDMTAEEVAKNVTDMCTLQMKSHSAYATSENYMYVLYEDTNREPFAKATEINTFLGLRPSHEVNTWITTNTRKTRHKRELDINDFNLVEETTFEDKIVQIFADDKGHNYTRTKYRKKEALQFESEDQIKLNEPEKVSRVLNPFSTNRNADAVLEKWPRELSFELVQKIQEGCSDLLNTFGYKLVTSREQYQDKNVSYLPDSIEDGS